MFKGQYFYHQHIRKAIIAFGTLFNNIQLRRSDENGDVLQSIFVPLSYAPKQKFIDRIREAPDLEPGRATFAITLPRIGFEITSFNYDASRKLSMTQTKLRQTFVSDLGFKLHHEVELLWICL